MFAWEYTVFLWHCMGRSASVDPLGIHNFARGMDALRITYDDSKANGAGDQVSPKNVYDNPLNPSICPMTALGMWMMLRNETFIANRDGIILENGTHGTASHRYCRQLGELFMDHRDKVSQFCCPERAKSHGFRKGSATLATSGTTNPPPLPSVSKRGEWSQGGVFDVYFLFAEPGDQYLGRCLTGLPQYDVNFSLLPSHFPCGIENDSVHEGLRLCFGNIMDFFQDSIAGLVGVLLLLLGSVVYHFESYVKPILANDPSFPFSGLALLRSPDLIICLRKLITTDSSPIILQATGITPHVEHTQMLNIVLEKVTTLTQMMLTYTEEVKAKVVKAIEERYVVGGILTINDTLEDRLRAHHLQFEEIVRQQLENERKYRPTHWYPAYRHADAPIVCDEEDVQLNDSVRHPNHYHSGRYRQTSKDWKFPAKTLRWAGWELWLIGQIGVVRPFRLLEPKFLSPDKKVRQTNSSGDYKFVVASVKIVRIESSVLLSNMPHSQPKPHVDRLIQE